MQRRGVRRRADAVPAPRARLRACAAADRAVHRDRRHLRQHRRPAAELQRRGAAAGRDAPGLEGAARARQPARRCRASTTTAPRRSAREALGGVRYRRTARQCVAESQSMPRLGSRAAASSASPKCRSISPTRSCAARRRCSDTRDAAAAGRLDAGRLMRAPGLARRRPGAQSRRTAARPCWPRRSTTACRRTACAIAAAHPLTARAGRHVRRSRAVERVHAPERAAV